MSTNVQSLLGNSPSSDEVSIYLKSLSSLVDGSDAAVPEVKSYPDAVYFNYFAIGLSFLFSPQNGYKPAMNLRRDQIKDDSLVLDSIDVYNIPKLKPLAANSGKSSRSAELAFSTHPVSPIILPLSISDGTSRPLTIEIMPDTTGQNFVACLGEPERKGGGAGPSSGSIGIWCEWPKDGIMVEFGGDEAKGPQAWERGKDAVWKIITIFPPKAT
ncbi:hypothetical protein SERLA73DRAFT_174145 [Serpula lacrymans var. lacrymans S7.3]|uniref:Uncharacterized protein n=2 Tax=Serpula lacrymans var. lacrymans TaxID=341189 RepID=F8PID5_SERL3|nr:uncharacterized protein SERLADRAFT_455228 [Serpula lacrymans var. lacrymans S7.9]EGO05178.1 hypothetical protein SERLA73DRAFT_174145 [Serpula lacrymans var. lacrymans S7.3]EGO30918.1 hypothetical protein SERLADRAFT_455228 [Serpula lacrymans var. lacrymans S7.9]